MSAEVEIVLHIVSVIIAAIAIAMVVIGIIRWKRKTHCPKFTVNATVVAKRAKVRRHSQNTDTGMQIVTDAFCYVTFRAADTNILELKVSEGEYMALNKGESGKLSFQGANFYCFEKANGEIISKTMCAIENEIKDETESEKKNEIASENKKRSRKRKQKVKVTSEVNSDTNSETSSDIDSEEKN